MRPVRMVSDLEAGTLDVSHVLIEAGAVGSSSALVPPGTQTVAEELSRHGAQVWLVAGLGRALPDRLFDALVARMHEPDDVTDEHDDVDLLALDLVDAVVGPVGLEAPGMAARRADCPIAPELRPLLDGDSPRDQFRQRFEQVRHLAPLEQMQAVDFQTYLPGDILVKADRAAMAYSLEARAPWLDRRLAEAACRLPAGFKLHGRRGKHVFKEAMAGYLPPDILTRPKMGFAVPLAQWFRGPLRPLFERHVYRPEMQELLCPVEARRLWAQHQSGLHDHSRKLWNLLLLARWNRERSQSRAERWTVVAA